MSGVRAPHLQRRNGIYHLRMRVPGAVRPLVGRAEVRRSFGTYSSTKARSLAARYAARVMEAFEVIATQQFSPQRAQMVIQNCFIDLIAEAEAGGGFIPCTAEPDLECADQVGLSQEVQAALREQLAVTRFEGSLIAQAGSLVGQRGVDLGKLEESTRQNLLSGVARILIERERWFQLRMSDRLSPFVPVDPLFTASPVTPLAQPVPPSSMGMSIAEAVESYLKHGKGVWVSKTLAARRWQLGFFTEHVGPETAIASISSDHIRSFRDAVRNLHVRHGKMKGLSFAAKQTVSPKSRISDKTASITFEPIKAFFRWAKSVEALVNTNPAEDIRLIATKQPKGQKVRRPFSAEELTTLFAAPIFTGCRSRHRRYEPGAHVIKDAKFWIPVLGLYTGARLGELVQLHVGDVQLTGDVPYLSINEENEAAAGVGDRKHVKSRAGIRLVPLHPDVMTLGFADFVARRALAKGRSRVRLFDEFPYGSDGVASTVASKWFARFMDKVGLTDRTLVFHSFRHNAEDAFRNAETPQYLTDRIIGHSDSTAASGYGEGAALQVLYKAVCGMSLKARVRTGVQKGPR